jgi:hypothetical protein
MPGACTRTGFVPGDIGSLKPGATNRKPSFTSSFSHDYRNNWFVRTRIRAQEVTNVPAPFQALGIYDAKARSAGKEL